MRLLGHPTNPQEPPTAWGAGVPRLPAGERGKRKAVNQQREPTLHLRPATPGRAERGRAPSTLTENAAGHDSRSPQTGGAGRQARAVKRRVPGTWDTERLASASGAAGGRPTRGEPGCFGGDNRAPEAGPSWGAPLGQKRGPGPGHAEAPRAWPGPGTWSGARSGAGWRGAGGAGRLGQRPASPRVRPAPYALWGMSRPQLCTDVPGGRRWGPRRPPAEQGCPWGSSQTRGSWALAVQHRHGVLGPPPSSPLGFVPTGQEAL